MWKICVLGAAILGSMSMSDARAAQSHHAEVEAWRAQRAERLKQPRGWLSLVGLHWLKNGANTIGSAADNDQVLAGGPAHLGVLTLADGRITLVVADDAQATVDGQPVRRAQLSDDTSAAPSLVAFGTLSFVVIERDGRHALRVWDSASTTLAAFKGIDSFPVDPEWRVTARWVVFDPAQTLDIPNVLGGIDTVSVPGKAVFEHDGETFELLPMVESADADQLFFVFADRTSGRQTYGGGRFLYTDMPTGGHVVLDFNKAYNPPCIFTPHATCPLAPPENRLRTRVTAGEKIWSPET